MRRTLIPIAAFLIGSAGIAGIYFGILIWAQGVDAVPGIFLPNRWYAIPIWITFGIQAALYSILRQRFALSLLFVLILVSCAQQANPNSTQPSALPVTQATVTPTDDPAILPTLFPNTDGASSMTRINERGAVIFEVTPLNLNTAAETLEFDISMNSHSVDLSMDLAQLATLSTDAGLTVQASKWDATPGGHHVSGKLIFPSSVQGTKSILYGASKLTLTIINVDATSRIFEWELK